MPTPTKRRIKTFVSRWEMAWHIFTITLYTAAIFAVILVFPDISNLWVSVLVLVGSFTASVAAMIAALKAQDHT